MAMTPQEKVIEIAHKEIGYLEKASNKSLEDKTANAGSANWTKYAAFLDSIGMYDGRKNGYAWCSVFVDWCMVQAFGLETALKITGQKLGGYGAGCTESANYYRRINRFFQGMPQPGDQIFFTNNNGKTMCHTGLVTKVNGLTVYTIEGNTSSAAGVVANGGAVRDKSYPLGSSRIGGYGRPRYEWVKEEKEDDNDMTNEKFDELMTAWLTEKAKENASWGQENLEWAKQIGIMQGDQQQRLMPNKFCTRLEVVTMLKRFADKLGLKG